MKLLLFIVYFGQILTYTNKKRHRSDVFYYLHLRKNAIFSSKYLRMSKKSSTFAPGIPGSP